MSVGLAVGFFAVVGWLAARWLQCAWTATPPALPAGTDQIPGEPNMREGKVWLGESWTQRRHGLRTLVLRGSPLRRGLAHGILLRNEIENVEVEFVELLRNYVPEAWRLALLRVYLLYRNRRLPSLVPLECQTEIHGVTLGCTDSYPEYGPIYHRLLNYHAAQDVSYMMIGNPLVPSGGCTAFAAWGGAAEEGHLITARNFDWEAAEVFDRDRVVIMVEPDEGIPFVSLSWASMVGAVSGMNRAGLSVTLNGVPSDLPRGIGTPSAIVARQLLQYASDLSEAIAALEEARVFVSSIWMIGSRSDGRFVVVEKTPTSTVVREAEDNTIVCTNHFLTSELRPNADLPIPPNDIDSRSRHARTLELLAADPECVGAETAAAIVRDRSLPGGRFAGNDHRGSLNAFIATHSTVMDLTEGIFWAACPPHQLGQFIAFDVNDFGRELPQRNLPADPALTSGELERTRQARAFLAEGHGLLNKANGAGALDCADKAERLNPGFYRVAMLRGRALLIAGKSDESVMAFEAALDGSPAFRDEITEIELLLAQARLE